jgi:UPF0271 protein
VGAHPGLPDLLGFGRRVMAVTPEDAHAYVAYQVGALQAFLDAADVPLHHVKLHGALAVVASTSEPVAAAILDAIGQTAPGRPIYSPFWPGNPLHELGEARGIQIIQEMYADMRYDGAGILIQERSKRAMPVEEAVAQVESFLLAGTVRSVDGEAIPIDAGSICFHGDGPNAIELAQAIQETVGRLGRRIAAPGGATTEEVPA